MAKVVTFGEIMLRLKSPGYERFFQSPVLEATFGGGEANVAVSLANYGMDASFVTVMPKNDIAEACIRELRGFGVDTKDIVRKDGRLGIYYLETGAVQRPSKVVYDRAGSAIAEAKAGDIDWKKVFDGATWFHLTGITPAFADDAAEEQVALVPDTTVDYDAVVVGCGAAGLQAALVLAAGGKKTALLEKGPTCGTANGAVALGVEPAEHVVQLQRNGIFHRIASCCLFEIRSDKTASGRTDLNPFTPNLQRQFNGLPGPFSNLLRRK